MGAAAGRPHGPHLPHLSSAASFAPISFAIKAKENDLLPLEKNRVKLDDDSDEDGQGVEGTDGGACAAAGPDPAVAPPCVGVEEKRPPLTQEELEAKQGLCSPPLRAAPGSPGGAHPPPPCARGRVGGAGAGASARVSFPGSVAAALSVASPHSRPRAAGKGHCSTAGASLSDSC